MSLEENARKYMENYFKEQEERQNKVSSQEYIDWVYNFISANKHADNESTLYTYEGIDKDNGEILGAFLNFVEDKAKEQRVLVVPDDDCDFDNEEVNIKIRDKFFKIFRMYGQGSWTSIGLLDKEPECAYVKL